VNAVHRWVVSSICFYAHPTVIYLVTVDIAALVARFAAPAFWKKSLQDEIESMLG
jgi:Ni/Fe-hydrogenase subunit HybB-like protein